MIWLQTCVDLAATVNVRRLNLFNVPILFRWNCGSSDPIQSSAFRPGTAGTLVS